MNIYKMSENDTQLILCIEEKDNAEKYPIDTRIFIGFSRNHNSFFLKGKRENTNEACYSPYSVHCSSKHTLCDLIEFVMGSKEGFNLSLYKYDNLEKYVYADLTYDYFKKNMGESNELVAYSNIYPLRKQIIKILKMLKYTYNDDEYDAE